MAEVHERIIYPADKLKICYFVVNNYPVSDFEIENYAQRLLSWRPKQSTISGILKKNDISIKQEGQAGRPSKIQTNWKSARENLLKKTPILKRTKRDTSHKGQALEHLVLREVFAAIIAGNTLISKEWLLGIINSLADDENHLTRPGKIGAFLKKLEKNYLLGEWTAKFFRGDITYAQMIQEIQYLNPSLQYVSTTPGERIIDQQEVSPLHQSQVLTYEYTDNNTDIDREETVVLPSSNFKQPSPPNFEEIDFNTTTTSVTLPQTPESSAEGSSSNIMVTHSGNSPSSLFEGDIKLDFFLTKLPDGSSSSGVCNDILNHPNYSIGINENALKKDETQHENFNYPDENQWQDPDLFWRDYWDEFEYFS